VRARKVRYTRAAQSDLAAAYDWYRAINPLLAERLIDDLRGTAERISSHPHSYPLFLGTCRRARLRVFSYFVYYRMETRSIVVHAILHARRSPGLHLGRAESPER